jgi:hypothetical protein
MNRKIFSEILCIFLSFVFVFVFFFTYPSRVDVLDQQTWCIPFHSFVLFGFVTIFCVLIVLFPPPDDEI